MPTVINLNDAIDIAVRFAMKPGVVREALELSNSEEDHNCFRIYLFANGLHPLTKKRGRGCLINVSVSKMTGGATPFALP